MKAVVLLGEGLGVVAVLCTMLFVTVDLGHPDRVWRMFPLVGRFNGPVSLLAWDIVVPAMIRCSKASSTRWR